MALLIWAILHCNTEKGSAFRCQKGSIKGAVRLNALFSVHFSTFPPKSQFNRKMARLHQVRVLAIVNVCEFLGDF